ncbi:ornithine cyclodeaminase family protein [Nocardioides mesophilus]|uniref:Ornithine cyclodeaminase family protein n=1 Tax=Nocardioides mesophilus TaxID=433659 RepID=A0A7G9R7Q7_9ACTN|nr:ornithine cyclodeaminase family protein [Nocardioides mesophilus]QNN51632.1 ornithine cyclodeaminase family protein [Nocardioides mesophilus]
MLVLSRTETESLLDLDALRHALRAAMTDVSAGRVSMPPRIAAMVPDRGLLAVMPAHLQGSGSLAAKLVSLFPGNAGTRLPTHQAVVVVFDADTGEPLALLDGISITTLRTAAGSALSAELLAREDAATLAILGTGVQARAHAEAMVRVRPIQRIRVAGRNQDRVGALCAALQDSLGIPALAADSYADACADADVICAATHSPDPVVRRDYLRPGVHVTSVGYNTEGREVDSATVIEALLVVESSDAVLASPPSGSNDLRTPIEEGLMGPEHIHAEIGELLLGTRPGRTSPDQITLYKSVGIAAQDVAAAHLVLTAAVERGLGLQVDLSA